MTLMCHPENFRESWMHARDYGFVAANPFGRDAMKKGKPSKVIVKPNETLRLRYAIFVHSGDIGGNSTVEPCYEEYLKLTQQELFDYAQSILSKTGTDITGEQAIKELQVQIDQSSKEAVIDKAAYTWFNRFAALEDQSLKSRIESLLERCGFRSSGVFVMVIERTLTGF